MFKQLKAITTMGAMAVALMAAAPASAQSPFPSAAREVGSSLIDQFWTPAMFSKMDANKDGNVSRQEFLAYMGSQFDRMDAKKRGMLSKAEFMDKKMMASTFPESTSKAPGE
jgi:Ca2+-binding EF-hand superfamily protein